MSLRLAILFGYAEERGVNKATILVVEDSELVLDLVEAILTPMYEVLRADSAEKGLSIGLEFPRPIHLLLADVVLPPGKVLGSDVAREIKQVRPQMRVIIMSAYPDGIAVLDAGWQYLEKPFVRSALLERVRSALTVQAAGGR